MGKLKTCPTLGPLVFRLRLRNGESPPTGDSSIPIRNGPDFTQTGLFGQPSCRENARRPGKPASPLAQVDDRHDRPAGYTARVKTDRRPSRRTIPDGTENRTGLTAAEVAQEIALGQVNRVKRSELAEYLGIVVRNVLTLFNALVVPAAFALFGWGRSAMAWRSAAWRSPNPAGARPGNASQVAPGPSVPAGRESCPGAAQMARWSRSAPATWSRMTCCCCRRRPGAGRRRHPGGALPGGGRSPADRRVGPGAAPARRAAALGQLLRGRRGSLSGRQGRGARPLPSRPRPRPAAIATSPARLQRHHRPARSLILTATAVVLCCLYVGSLFPSRHGFRGEELVQHGRGHRSPRWCHRGWC